MGRADAGAEGTDRVSGVRTRLLRRAAQTIVSSLIAVGIALLVGVSASYAFTPIVRFPEPTPFVGKVWYNPYDGLDGRGPQWRVANFHAHSAAWGGMTNGAQPADSVVAAYRKLKYDVVGVSNYQASPEHRPAGAFPVYEHGWNLLKAHHLLLGPERVVWRDYPLIQTRSQQQLVLSALSQSASMVAIAHPSLRGAHSPNDLRYLSDYDLLEVLTRYTAPADAAWDAALSSGHPVWMLASDDSHNSADSTQVGINATRIYSNDAGSGSIIGALRAGRSYGVHGSRGRGRLALRSLRMRADTLDVRIDGAPDTLRVIGQEGVVRAQLTGAAAREGRLTVVAHETDGYLRVVATGNDALLYLNPVLRWDGRDLPRPIAFVDGPRTALWRSAWMLAFGWLGAQLFLARERARARRLRPVPRTAVAKLAAVSGE